MKKREFNKLIVELEERLFHVMNNDFDDNGAKCEEVILIDFLSENHKMLSNKSISWFLKEYIGRCLTRKELKRTNIQELRDSLEEYTTYLVEVATSKENVVHNAILFMGFKSGGYCKVLNCTYEYPIKMDDYYYIKVIKKLENMKK